MKTLMIAFPSLTFQWALLIAYPHLPSNDGAFPLLTLDRQKSARGKHWCFPFFSYFSPDFFFFLFARLLPFIFFFFAPAAFKKDKKLLVSLKLSKMQKRAGARVIRNSKRSTRGGRTDERTTDGRQMDRQRTNERRADDGRRTDDGRTDGRRTDRRMTDGQTDDGRSTGVSGGSNF